MLYDCKMSMVLIPSEHDVLADKKGRVDFPSGFFTEYRVSAPFWHLPRGGFLHGRPDRF